MTTPDAPPHHRDGGLSTPTQTPPSPISRLVLIGFVLVMAVGLAALRPGDIRSAGPRPDAEILIDLGDVVRVKGGSIGCRVTRRAGFPGQKILDCRRAGPLPGTFGALLGHRKLLVVRFKEGGVANVVFTGTHQGESAICQR
jgi:hypothetical protein